MTGPIDMEYPFEANKLPSRLAKLGFLDRIVDQALEQLLDKLALQTLISLTDEDGNPISSPVTSGTKLPSLTITRAAAEKISDLHSSVFPNATYPWVVKHQSSSRSSATNKTDDASGKLSKSGSSLGLGDSAKANQTLTDKRVSSHANIHAMGPSTSKDVSSTMIRRKPSDSGLAETDSMTDKPTTEAPTPQGDVTTTTSSANGTNLSDDTTGSAQDEPNVESLLGLLSAKEKQIRRVGSEILDLLSRPTAKERSMVEKFRSADGYQVREFCQHGTKDECARVRAQDTIVTTPIARGWCHRLHFRKIIQKHTDTSLGDCSFLNTCFHMNSCKYIHYEVDYADLEQRKQAQGLEVGEGGKSPLGGPEDDLTVKLYPQQWIQCDLRSFDLTILGKFSVIMADPPWDIHMELPYGTMSDDEMRNLKIQVLQDEGLIFLWVTGRAMELGRDCLRMWGYDQCDEILWVKTNQLQRIIRTGRTGHWLNHGKEHCLVGYKGSLDHYNRLDCDVIVAEVRETSHKPDEVYGLIERLSPGTRKLELFGRMHNAQKNWITLGNQLDGIRLLDPEVVSRFKQNFPDGNCMKKPNPKP